MNIQIAKKTERPKVDSFKAWLEAKPYWEQYLWQLHMTRKALDETDIEKCYQYLLEDSNIVKEAPGRTPIIFPAFDLDDADITKVKSTLDKIENLKNVNALDSECVIEFGKNLTIIYGDNGTGKSGIGRLLSNACNSRKPRKLLPNAKTVSYPATVKATADFHISDTSGSKVINYTVGEIHDILKSFSVFDHECALIHLNSENKVEFVPSKIQIFDEVFRSIVTIEAKLKEEIDTKTKDNPAEGIFTGVSKVTEFLDSLSHITTDKQIDDALTFTKVDKKSLGEKKGTLSEKQKQDISKQKKELTDECSDLNTFKTTLSGKSTILSAVKADEINTLIKEIKEKKDIADKLSVKNFKFSAFKNIGSLEWKSLIAAAQKLHEKEVASNAGTELDYCLLCRQTLTSTERSLFGEYWEFLKSTSESELATARQALAMTLSDLEKENNSWPEFPGTEVAVKILKKDLSAKLAIIQTAFGTLRTQLLSWIENIKKEQDVIFTDPKIDLDPITILVMQKKETEVKLIDPIQEINTLNDEISYLEQKRQTSNILTKLKEYAAWLRWKNIVDTINLPAVRGNTTRKKTEIMDELVISQYIDIFNKETEKLDCNFGLKVESHGSDVETVKELRLEFARGYSPSEILSEGEQTVSALADFLTEAELNKNNSGIIFDDPVSSLDHLRKTIIAKRLVEEAKERQVIVLTHDISFLLDLQTYAENDSVIYAPVSMRKNGDRVGVIKQELPWFALNVKSRVGYLKNELPRLKKLEGSDQDEYQKEVKGWYEFLREAWERAVEERLFNGVVQRFNHAIQTQRLRKLVITPELIMEVNDGMTESSKWLHDMAPGVNPAVPKSTKLEVDIKLLEDFITKCQPN